MTLSYATTHDDVTLSCAICGCRRGRRHRSGNCIVACSRMCRMQVGVLLARVLIPKSRMKTLSPALLLPQSTCSSLIDRTLHAFTLSLCGSLGTNYCSSRPCTRCRRARPPIARRSIVLSVQTSARTRLLASCRDSYSHLRSRRLSMHEKCE